MSEQQHGDTAAAAHRTIDLDTMSLEELNQMKQQEEGRLQALSGRYAALRSATNRLNLSKEAVAELSPAQEGSEVMVPMTDSVYVPGFIREPNKIMVDLGTGFYCEKSSKDTTAFLDRKLRLVEHNSENVTKAMEVTRQNIVRTKYAVQVQA